MENQYPAHCIFVVSDPGIAVTSSEISCCCRVLRERAAKTRSQTDRSLGNSLKHYERFLQQVPLSTRVILTSGDQAHAGLAATELGKQVTVPASGKRSDVRNDRQVPKRDAHLMPRWVSFCWLLLVRKI